jgi:hypothetical protein
VRLGYLAFADAAFLNGVYGYSSPGTRLALCRPTGESFDFAVIGYSSMSSDVSV